MQPVTIKPIFTRTLYDLPGKFGGWPSIARSAEGELLVVFSGDRKHHVDPYGKTILVRSLDQGSSWSDPQIINNSPLDDRDAGIVVCPDGRWLVSLFTSQLYATWTDSADYYGEPEVAAWRPFIERLTPELRREYLGYFTIISHDQGLSWSTLRRAPVTAPHGPVLGSQGELIFLGNQRDKGRASIACYVSTNSGEAWQKRGVLADANCLEGIYLCEPHLAQLPDGRLLGLMRVNAADVEKRQLMQSFSKNGGRTWSPVESTGIWGLPPHLLQHSSGALLASFGHRREPFGQRVAVSLDGGKTWPHILSLATIETHAGTVAQDVGEIFYQTPDLGYPATVELGDGSLFTVWYQSRPDRTGALIEGCCWQLSGIKSHRIQII